MSYDNANYLTNSSDRSVNFTISPIVEKVCPLNTYDGAHVSHANEQSPDWYDILKSGSFGVKSSSNSDASSRKETEIQGAASAAYMEKFGFSTPPLVGFDQESPNQDCSLWHSFKHAFVKDDSNDEVIRQTLERQLAMNPDFLDEEKANKEYQSALARWEAQMSLNPGPMPQSPDMPLHQELEKQVAEVERNISMQVQSGMSPTDCKRVRSEISRYDDATRIRSLIGTGEGFRPRPALGFAVRDYYDRIGEATQKWAQSQVG